MKTSLSEETPLTEAAADERDASAGDAAEGDAAESGGEHAVLEIALLPDPDAAGPEAPRPLPEKIEGIVVGKLLDVTADSVKVTFPGAPEAGVAARSMVDLEDADRGAEVAMMFERGNPARPVVLGKMAKGFGAEDDARAATVTRDGERLVLSAEEEIVLKCGDASITLTKAGKVLLRGAYVSSRSTGVNRIQGGSVEIN
jgi:hypothetical protein